MSAQFTIYKIFKPNRAKYFARWINLNSVKCSKYYQVVDPMPVKCGGKHNVTVLPGTGIGPEIMKSAIEVLEAAEAPLSYEIIESKPEEEDKNFHHMITSIKRNKVAIKANIETSSRDPLVQSKNVLLRKLLDLYVYVLPCKTIPGVPTRYPEIDVIIVRQNTEGEYLMLEHEPVKGSVESLKVLTRYNSERLAEYAYKYAIDHGRKQVTVLHTADVENLTEGFFVRAAMKVSQRYPQIMTSIKEAGVATLDIVKAPKNYDVILATNLNGSMISTCINGMLGGPALSAGINCNEIGIAVFEPGVRNKGSSIVNKGIANPVAMIMAACHLLHYLGHDKISDVIRSAIYNTIAIDRMFTNDLGGKAITRQITDNIIRHVKQILGPQQKQKGASKVKHKRWEIASPDQQQQDGDDDNSPRKNQ